MNKMKLELKHLAPYLPYGLKVMAIYDIPDSTLGFNKIRRNEVVDLIGIWKDDEARKYLRVRVLSKHFNTTSDRIKPILRPLSDLTKEIRIQSAERGLFFIPLTKLSMNLQKRYQYEELNEQQNWLWYDVQKLFEWHFDVFGLIEKGLAIDINTVKDD